MKFFKARPLQAPSCRNNLRRAGFVCVAAVIAYFLIGGATTITTILHPLGCFIGIRGRGGWGRGLHSRRWRSIGVGGILFTCLLFFVRVTDDDDAAITRQPKKTTVEVTEVPLGKILIP
jgi:hypothetical protein